MAAKGDGGIYNVDDGCINSRQQAQVKEEMNEQSTESKNNKNNEVGENRTKNERKVSHRPQ